MRRLIILAAMAFAAIAPPSQAAVDCSPNYTEYGSVAVMQLAKSDCTDADVPWNASLKTTADTFAAILNADLSLKAPVTAAKWQQVTGPVTWLSATSFKVPETAQFETGIKVWVVQAVDVIGSVASASTAAGETTVTLSGIVLYSDNATPSTVTDTISSVSVSMVTPRSDVAPPSIPSTITDLSDTPSTLTANTMLKVNSGGTALETFDSTPFHLYSTASQTIANGTWTHLDFDGSKISNGNVTTGTGAYFTVPVTGVYYFSAGYSLTVNPNTEHIITGLSFNGSFPYCTNYTNASYSASYSSNQYLTNVVSCLWPLTAGTVVRIATYHDTGASRSTLPGSSYSWFQGYRIR